MSKRFQIALVVGKFAPLHRGHELLIRRALEESEKVFIISYSKPEFPGCEPERREVWLKTLFPSALTFVATDARLAALRGNSCEFSQVPANDAENRIHRRFCGFICAQVLNVAVDAVFTSEEYGDGFAAELTGYFRRHGVCSEKVAHVLVDPSRRLVPISGTVLRQDIHGNRKWLPPQVYGSFVQRVCLLGGESTGKSTLAEALARKCNTEFVHEYGRKLWEAKNGQLVADDMLQIARQQIQLEEAAAGRSNRFLFCDTSPLTTLFYSRQMFGQADPELECLADRRYDRVILCAPDFPFVQDGTRQPESFRDRQHAWYLTELQARRIPFLLAQGTLLQRIDSVLASLVSSPHPS